MRPSAAVACSLLVLAIAAIAPAPSVAAARERAAASERADGRAAAGRRADGTVLAEGMSLDHAVETVQRRYNAKVVRAEETREGGEVVYRIRLLSGDGRVFTVRVNARTGQID